MPNLTFNIADLIGTDFDARRTKVWIEANVDPIIDTAGKVIHFGDAKAAVGDDGTGVFTGLIATNATGVNPTGFLYRVWVDYVHRADGQREQWNSGWFVLTADTDLALVAPVTNAPPPTATTDSVTAANLNNSGSLSADATRTIARSVSLPRWRASTAYAAGDAVLAPDGSLVKAKATFTSGTTYSATNWTTANTTSGTQARTELDATYDRQDSTRIKTLAVRHADGDLVPDSSQTVEANSPHLNSIAFDGFTLLTGSYPGGNIWASYDKGLSWQSMGKPGGDSTVDDIAFIKAARPGVFYAGCSNSGAASTLYKSTDSGATWTLAFRAASAAEATEGLAIECVGRTVLIGGFNRVGGTSASIWRSTDDGATFTKVSTTTAGSNTIRQIRHVYPNTYIATVSSATPNQMDIYFSSDSGATWTATQTITSTATFTAMALPPNGGVLLGTHPGAKIYRSTNFGQAPYTQVADLGLGPGQSQVMGLTRAGKSIIAFVNRNDNAEAVAYVSDDSGTTWTKVATLDQTYHYHEPVAIDGRTIIAPAANNGSTGTRGAIFRMSWYG